MLSFANFKSLTRIEQTLFGLPFVISGSLLPFAEKGFQLVESPFKLLWILPGFFAARVAGMAFNQLIDRHIDARNPRTKDRSLPSNRVKPKEAAWVAWGSLGIMLLIGAQLNKACVYSAPFIALLLFSYSYMKRLHASCHFVLGLIHFLAPIMAWVAVTGYFAWPPLFLGLASLFSIAGNDILYAFQDYQFDLEEGLHSIPVSFGLKQSLFIAKASYGLALLSLVLLGLIAHLGVLFYFAPLLLLFLFYVFHRLKERAFKHFFFLSVAPGFTVMIFLAADILWRVLL